jgi:hypothetical protein
MASLIDVLRRFSRGSALITFDAGKTLLSGGPQSSTCVGQAAAQVSIVQAAAARIEIGGCAWI